MKSIYEQALGREFKLLHPRIQQRFGFSSRDNVACIGTGTMEKIWHGAFYTMPFPIKNYAYVDEHGRETVTWIRTFETAVPRRFDAYMIYSEQRRRVVDYLGTHQHLAVDIDLSVDERGGLLLRSGAQRFYEKSIGFSFPMTFSGVAEVCEWYEESDQQFHIEVDVRNRVWGPLFGYSGSFQVKWLPVKPDEIPADIMPIRCERRE